MVALSNCLYEGMNFLLPPLCQRILIAYKLLKVDPTEIRKSQKINLRLILQSINDPKTIGNLMQLCHGQDGVVNDVIALLTSLLTKDGQNLVSIFDQHTRFLQC